MKISVEKSKKSYLDIVSWVEKESSFTDNSYTVTEKLENDNFNIGRKDCIIGYVLDSDRDFVTLLFEINKKLLKESGKFILCYDTVNNHVTLNDIYVIFRELYAISDIVFFDNYVGIIWQKGSCRIEEKILADLMNQISDLMIQKELYTNQLINTLEQVESQISLLEDIKREHRKLVVQNRYLKAENLEYSKKLSKITDTRYGRLAMRFLKFLIRVKNYLLNSLLGRIVKKCLHLTKRILRKLKRMIIRK